MGPIAMNGDGCARASQPGDTCLSWGRNTDKRRRLRRKQTLVFEETGVLWHTESQAVYSGTIRGPGSKSNWFIACLESSTNKRLSKIAMKLLDLAQHTAAMCYCPSGGWQRLVNGRGTGASPSQQYRDAFLLHHGRDKRRFHESLCGQNADFAGLCQRAKRKVIR